MNAAAHRWFASGAALLGVLLFSVGSFAAELQTRVSAQRVGVGQTVVVQVTVPVGDDDPEPRNAQLPVRGKARVSGPSIQSQRSIVMHNFNVRSETNIIASWRVTPLEAGKLVLGPAQFSVGKEVLRGDAISIEVVDHPQPQQRGRGPFGRDPFGSDPFDIFGQDPFGRSPSDPFGRLSRLQEAPRQWQLDHAADPIAFLHARLDAKKVVLGEPVHLTILAYGSRGEFLEQAQQSPSLADFVSFPVLADQMDEPFYQTTIDGQNFLVRKIREYVIVPLSTGNLPIGAMTTILQSRRGTYPNSGSNKGMKVSTLPLELIVTEAPEPGRPPGYFPGDVGRYELETEVTPRELKQGEYAQVLVTVKGTGYVPSKVLLPESNSLKWNTPTVRGEPEVQNGRLQGSRTLDYAVQLNETGQVNLGVVRLPYYDPQSKRYRVATADLGAIDVSPAPDRKPSSPAAAGSTPDASPSSFTPRTELSSAPQAPLVPPPFAWWTVLGLPALAGLLKLLGHWGQKWKSRSRRTKAKGAEAHLAEARSTFDAKKIPTALGHLERALITAIENTTSVKARGVLKSELAARLREAKVPEAQANSIADLLQELESIRYAPQADGNEELLERTEYLIKELSTTKKNARKGKS